MRRLLKEFFTFLEEYKIVTLAVGFVMGTASTALVGSLVKDIILPIIAPLVSNGSFKDAVWNIGPIAIAYGSFLTELLNFIILAFIIFLIAGKILKDDKKKKN